MQSGLRGWRNCSRRDATCHKQIGFPHNGTFWLTQDLLFWKRRLTFLINLYFCFQNFSDFIQKNKRKMITYIILKKKKGRRSMLDFHVIQMVLRPKMIRFWHLALKCRHVMHSPKRHRTCQGHVLVEWREQVDMEAADAWDGKLRNGAVVGAGVGGGWWWWWWCLVFESTKTSLSQR